jgi:RNA 3'-terminal phosphate cyclase (ATP)
MLKLDGSMGEGGGSLLRTSLSLSALTGRPFTIENIRANRSKPGLRPQHLTAVRASAKICQAELSGDQFGATRLEFHPTMIPQPGDYRFDVMESSPSGLSAGSVTLIIQTLLWPLAYTGAPSKITARGGTFVPFSPPYHYLSEVVEPLYKLMGLELENKLVKWGWMSAGGGCVETNIDPTTGLQALKLVPRAVEKITGVAAVTNLPSHIPQRMSARADKLIRQRGLSADIKAVRETGDGPGAGIVLWIPQAGFSSLGRPGLPAEKVADAVIAEINAFIENGAAVDQFLADQLLVPMALANGVSSFTTNRITGHTLTTIELLRLWLGISIAVEGAPGNPGQIEVHGIGYRPTE